MKLPNWLKKMAKAEEELPNEVVTIGPPRLYDNRKNIRSFTAQINHSGGDVDLYDGEKVDGEMTWSFHATDVVPFLNIGDEMIFGFSEDPGICIVTQVVHKGWGRIQNPGYHSYGKCKFDRYLNK